MRNRFLFIIDPPHTLNPKKDSTLALMQEVASRSIDVYFTTLENFSLHNDDVSILATKPHLFEKKGDWWEGDKTSYSSTTFDLVLMRKEPPVDTAFVYTTYVLDIINKKTPVTNHPEALRGLNEKLAILNFPEWIAPTWTGFCIKAATDFYYQQGAVVLKPLNGMGGQGIYIATEGDKNFRSVFDTLSHGGKRMLMAQAYLPAAHNGDWRVFVVGGKPLDVMLVRVPRENDYRGNMAAGGIATAHPLDNQARQIAESIAPKLLSYGIHFAGLDIIDGKLIEINITCPTGLCEVKSQTENNIAATITDYYLSLIH